MQIDGGRLGLRPLNQKLGITGKRERERDLQTDHCEFQAVSLFPGVTGPVRSPFEQPDRSRRYREPEQEARTREKIISLSG